MRKVSEDFYVCLRKQRYMFWYACRHGGEEGFMGRKLTAVTKIGYPLTLMQLIKINYEMTLVEMFVCWDLECSLGSASHTRGHLS
ncbi:hypothetical protein R3I93_020139 [Phoxinus phoxinus]|uniref:Uncharacterized protein n=1 Tax=Phoxinus phoxinus TaxID=58324 RepID=A0AAN9CAP2_9TELE